ncbi:C2 domain-containing protein 2 isoform X2 [Monodelphis domestica]|uniref:C2 domain-containing protein 2 isoform X2 n=1 Tax=Monodelphis domestica TaxID=13616 RepID=UPI0024E20A1D|nr:C2 domain-containing protein 2 isoform X2 [Monodelphis domestica]
MACPGSWTEAMPWLAAVTLFLAALVTVSRHLVQCACGPSADSLQPIRKDDWGFLLKWVLSLHSWRSQWRAAWLTALNEEARQSGGPPFLTFEEEQLQQPFELAVHPVVNAVKSVQEAVSWNVGGDSISFVVHVLSASCGASQGRSYDVRLSPFHLQLELHMKEKREDILIKWSFLNVSEMNIKIQPKARQEGPIIGALGLCRTLEETLKRLFSSVSPSVLLSTKTLDVRNAQDMLYTSTIPQDLCPPKPPRAHKLKLLVKNIRATLLKNAGASGSLSCVLVAQLNDPFQTFFGPVTESTTDLAWSEELPFELNARSKELRMHVSEDGNSKESLFFALATVPVDVFKRKPSGPQSFVLSSGPHDDATVLGSVTAEFFYLEPSESESWKIPPLVPAAKINKDPTVMPCGTTNGTLITTPVTAMKRNPELDAGPSPELNSDFLMSRQRSSTDDRQCNLHGQHISTRIFFIL